jgi:outer membrane usher protein FimD/PapC
VTPDEEQDVQNYYEDHTGLDLNDSKRDAEAEKTAVKAHSRVGSFTTNPILSLKKL